MLLVKETTSLLPGITEKQKSIVDIFMSVPVRWNEIQHGDKVKLEENITVVFINAKGSNDFENVLEAHRKFYDLHYTAEGNDVIVSKSVAICSNIKTPYNEEGDYILFNEPPVECLNVAEGNFCLIPPTDAHMALYGECGLVKKIVFKIPVQQ